jgi:hypothetical protein
MTLRASLEQASMAVERILLMRSSTQFGTGISSGVEPSGLSRMTADLYRKRPGRKGRTTVSWSRPGRFGPSRKEEAAARRAVCYKLWALNATEVRATQEAKVSPGLTRDAPRQTALHSSGMHQVRESQAGRNSVRFGDRTHVEQGVTRGTRRSRD